MEVEKVIKGLEAAALTSARALEEVSSHWDSVYRAMRRAEWSPPSAHEIPGRSWRRVGASGSPE